MKCYISIGLVFLIYEEKSGGGQNPRHPEKIAFKKPSLIRAIYLHFQKNKIKSNKVNKKIYLFHNFTKFLKFLNMPETECSSTRIFLHNDRIYNSAIIRENTGLRKLVSWHIPHSHNLFNCLHGAMFLPNQTPHNPSQHM